MKSQLKVQTGFTALLLFLCSALPALAADGSSLKPPAGARVAIVVFEDLECPTCARTFPLVWEVSKARNVPLVLRDYPLPNHTWSFDAAVYARYFDTHSQKLGDDFRAFIYKSQVNVTRQNLRLFAQKYADDNKVPMPFVIDPEGKLKAKVKEDYDLGQRISIAHTPTIFVLGAGGTGSTPYQEVTDPNQLSQIVEDMQKKYPAPAAPVKKTVKGTKAVAKKK